MNPELESIAFIRDFNPAEDESFIMATWLMGLYYGDTWFKKIPKDIFMDNYKGVLEAILRSESTKVRVSCLKDTPGVILGYSVLGEATEGPTVHWTFVKKAWRGQGIAKSLLPPTPVFATHLSAAGESFMSKLFPNCKFNPFAI